MPNGESRNWIRLTITLGSFYGKYGHWPSAIQLPSFFVSELQRKLSERDFQILQSKVAIAEDDDNPFLASDKSGNSYDYSANGPYGPTDLQVSALDWLGIKEPEYYD